MEGDYNLDCCIIREKEYMNWIPIEELGNHVIYPEFFVDRLRNLPLGVQHIVTREI